MPAHVDPRGRTTSNIRAASGTTPDSDKTTITSGRAASSAGTMPNNIEGTTIAVVASSIPSRRIPPTADIDAEAFMRHRHRAFTATLRVRQQLFQHARDTAQVGLAARLALHGLPLPTLMADHSGSRHDDRPGLDTDKQRVFSEFVGRSSMLLPEFVRLIRGETSIDSRPNKALEIPSHLPGWTAYTHRSE